MSDNSNSLKSQQIIKYKEMTTNNPMHTTTMQLNIQDTTPLANDNFMVFP